MRSFRRKSSLLARKTKRASSPKRKHEASPRKRGYDADWDKLSIWYRKFVGGICEECRRRGQVSACDVVDHMIPVRDDRSRRLDRSNLDALCNSCHNGFKRRIEKYARATGQVFMLPLWIKYPETRPMHFQFKKVEPNVHGDIAINAPVRADAFAATPILFDAPEIEKEVFEGAGTVTAMANYSDVPIEIMDDGESVYLLGDGENLNASLEIRNGLSVIATMPGTGKISLAYVEGSSNI